MGIAIKRHPVRAERQQFLYGVGDLRRCLMRQAEQDVGVQAGDPGGADGVDGVAGDFVALVPADAGLDRGVEVLHADGGAVHARPGKGVEAGGVDFVRVDLDGEFVTGGEGRDIADRPREVAHHPGFQQGRRAAAPVQARQAHAPGQMPCQQRQFLLQRFDIGRHRRQGRGALRAAGAEPAEPAAEGHMQVERDPRPIGYRTDPVGKPRRIHATAELRGGRIAGVAGHPGVEKSKSGKLYSVAHGDMNGARARCFP